MWPPAGTSDGHQRGLSRGHGQLSDLERQLGSLRAREGFSHVNLSRATDLQALPVVAAAASERGIGSADAVAQVVREALADFPANNLQMEALRATLGITVEGTSADERRRRYKKVAPGTSSEETLKSREKAAIQRLVARLIDDSQRLKETPVKSQDYWRLTYHPLRQFKNGPATCRYRLGPGGLPIEAEYDKLLVARKDGITRTSVPGKYTGERKAVKIDVVEGGSLDRLLIPKAADGFARYGIKLDRRIRSGETIRLRWRFTYTHKPGDEPPDDIFGDDFETAAPFVRYEVAFDPRRKPKRVEFGIGPISNWPERCPGGLQRIKLDPDLTARVTFGVKRSKQDVRAALRWRW